jgi:hypothetical protein
MRAAELERARQEAEAVRVEVEGLRTAMGDMLPRAAQEAARRQFEEREATARLEADRLRESVGELRGRAAAQVEEISALAATMKVGVFRLTQ